MDEVEITCLHKRSTALMSRTGFARRLRATCVFALICNYGTALGDAIGFEQPRDATSARTQIDPADLDTLHVFASEQHEIDDNLFRLPSASVYPTAFVGPIASRGDRIDILSFGAKGARTWNDQIAQLNLHIDENRYARNSAFDGVTGNGEVILDWSANPLITGQVGAIYDRSIPNFQDTQFYSPDIFSHIEGFAKAQLQGGPHWTMTGGLGSSKIQNSNDLLKSNDFRDATGSFGVHYFTLAEDWIGLDYLYNNGRFNSPGILGGVPYNRDFHDNSGRAAAQHTFSSKLLLLADVGYLQHKTVYGAVGSFSGDVWRASLLWQPLVKLQFTLAGWRDLASYVDAQSAFFVSNGYSLEPTWTPRDKIKFSVKLASETHRFLGSGDAVVPEISTSPGRLDTLRVEQIAVAYTPRTYLSLRFSYAHQGRSSNIARYSYDDNIFSLFGTFIFLGPTG